MSWWAGARGSFWLQLTIWAALLSSTVALARLGPVVLVFGQDTERVVDNVLAERAAVAAHGLRTSGDTGPLDDDAGT